MNQEQLAQAQLAQAQLDAEWNIFTPDNNGNYPLPYMVHPINPIDQVRLDATKAQVIRNEARAERAEASAPQPRR
jgi:hypothetical protein